MRGKQESLEIVARALQVCRADEAQAVLCSRRLESTSYADNRIEQGTTEQNETVYLRVRYAGREAWGVASGSDDAALLRLAEDLARTTLLAPPVRALPPLPGPQQYPETHPFNPLTALWTAEQRSEAVALIVEQARGNRLAASGVYRTGVRQVAIANTSGLRAFESRTDAALQAIVVGAGDSGYGDAYARDVAQINPLDVAEQAIAKALMGSVPTSIGPGDYEVVLEQNAVADLIRCLRPGFGARAVREGQSFLSDRFGRAITGSRVTLTDDPLSPDGLHSAFDFEGIPRQSVELLREGVAVGSVHDTNTAAATGTVSTGHAAQPAATDGSSVPVPSSLFMEHGEAEMETMIGSIRRGLLVSRFQQLRVVDPVKALVRGQTQHGTFLIENGVLSRPIADLRFEEDLLPAFRGIEQVSRERKLVVEDASDEPHCIVAPALHLRRFRFVGSVAL